jgi:transcriptional regulator with XRE-family HTH domain
MKTLTVIGAQIAKHRELAGLTQLQVAKKLRVDQSVVSHWESGRRSPSALNFKRLCAALGVRPVELTTPTDDVTEAGAA